MARFKLLQDAYIGDQYHKAGAVIDVDPKVTKPGPHMGPVDAEVPMVGPVQLVLSAGRMVSNTSE